ncbi:hypothetical protein GGTG_09221 [Gaeumannomyces tritici R3-111a-1]|uniref:Glycosyl hydrolase family 13 catalytic domain-containing protein n=1 Tax=Gaeumannomyces tritici (strain R3-111a-1) TaxID=644352 RepID=J3P6S9_GAET3|nr:hypothetical protein GGTG_09221 [Gaeumannomyces tritici R3-111a-1]EJT72355.1 hypothetical protein GGTG_09221 [Gaeumannomyces tritici R3-111a-1]
MAYPADFLNRRSSAFSLWTPGRDFGTKPPQLVLGRYDASAPGSFVEVAHRPLAPAADGKKDLWELSPRSLSLAEDTVYHYWFELDDTSPERRGRMLVTDPFAFTVDYRLKRGVVAGADAYPTQPASVIKHRAGALHACDVDGDEPGRVRTPPQASLPANNHLVIYELPVTWARAGVEGGVEVDKGTFADVRALFAPDAEPVDHAGRPGFAASIPALGRGRALLAELGVNALELLPAADAAPRGEWGYATANYLAPDADMGSASDLAALVETVHGRGVRLFTDVVMAFGHDPYQHVDFPKFHLRAETETHNPDAYQSNAVGQKREGWGGQLWRYLAEAQDTYNPQTGDGGLDPTRGALRPAWEFHKLALARWMTDFGVCSLRLDSVNNIGNWDFVRAYKERAWQLYRDRYGSGARDDGFLVIGEELSMPLDMVRSGVLDALWNEPWQERARSLLLGEAGAHDGGSFEATVRRVVDCTSTGFSDGSQAVNYLTSHDVEGYRKERLFDFLTSSGVWDVGGRAKLAFVLLLTSVGVPMIFAGEEFADQMDRSRGDMRYKQTDPVNYERVDGAAWRRDLFAYVARLVRFRTECPALGVDDTDFIHVDRSRGGKVLAWTRGGVRAGQAPVVVVANFTDNATPGAEYVVPNWPGRGAPGWREVTQSRDVPGEWVGREPLMAWEAKVYTRWK